MLLVYLLLGYLAMGLLLGMLWYAYSGSYLVEGNGGHGEIIVALFTGIIVVIDASCGMI